MNLKKPFFWDEINLLAIFLYPLSLITYFVNILKKISNKKNLILNQFALVTYTLGVLEKHP